MHTSIALVGFLASTPQLVVRSNGERRAHVKIGQGIYTRDDTGKPRRTDTAFGDLVLYGRAAQEMFDRFAEGDTFVAEGEMRTHVRPDGTTTRHFHARRIGHDTSTSYTVQRSEPRPHARPSGPLAEPTPGTATASPRHDTRPGLGL